MSTPTTAFVVTAGEYSHYHIITVFLDREAAEKFCETAMRLSTYEHPQVEEFTIGKRVEDHYTVEVQFDKLGKAEISESVVDYMEPNCWINSRTGLAICYVPYSTDHNILLKSAQDMRAEELARRAGI